jgi:hypothetical protein
MCFVQVICSKLLLLVTCTYKDTADGRQVARTSPPTDAKNVNVIACRAQVPVLLFDNSVRCWEGEHRWMGAFSMVRLRSRALPFAAPDADRSHAAGRVRVLHSPCLHACAHAGGEPRRSGTARAHVCSSGASARLACGPAR